MSRQELSALTKYPIISGAFILFAQSECILFFKAFNVILAFCILPLTFVLFKHRQIVAWQSYFKQ